MIQQNEDILNTICKHVDDQPFSRKMGLKLVCLGRGYAKVEMAPDPESRNLFGFIHGGAIYSLIDQAFCAAANSYGTVSVALNVNVIYHNPATPKEALYAEAKEVSRSKRISTYQIEVRDHDRLIATCQAIAYRKEDLLPLL
jgi:acyl-CoA thioesterase